MIIKFIVLTQYLEAIRYAPKLLDKKTVQKVNAKNDGYYNYFGHKPHTDGGRLDQIPGLKQEVLS